MSNITPAQFRALIPSAWSEDWGDDFLALLNANADMAQGILDALAGAGAGTALVISPRTKTEILAYASPLPGMLCQSSVSGHLWGYISSWVDLSARDIPVVFWQPDADNPPTAGTAAGAYVYLFSGATATKQYMWAQALVGNNLGCDLLIKADGVTRAAGTSKAASFNLAYLVVPQTSPLVNVVGAWKPSRVVATTDYIVPTVPNGYIYKCSTAGTCHASTEPTWPTTISQTVSDGTAVWTCQQAGFVNVAQAVNVPDAIATRFAIAGSTWKIPSTAFSAATDLLILLFWRNPDAAGDTSTNIVGVADTIRLTPAEV